MTSARSFHLRYGRHVDKIAVVIVILAAVAAAGIGIAATLHVASGHAERPLPAPVFRNVSLFCLAAAVLILLAGLYLAQKLVDFDHRGRREGLDEVFSEAVETRSVEYKGTEWSVIGREPDTLRLTLSRPDSLHLTVFAGEIARDRGLLPA